MGAAFSTEIDLEDIIGRGASASASMFKLSRAFENLAESVGSANVSSGQFSELAGKMDNALKLVFSSMRNLSGNVDSAGKRLVEFGQRGEDAMLVVRASAKLAGYTLRVMVAPLRLIIWAFDLISKMNPFGFLSKAYDQFTKIYDKIKEISKGSTSLNLTAKGMRTTAKNLTNFEKAYELVGFDRSVISDITNAIDGGALGDLAAIGLDSEELKKLDGIEAFFKIYEAAQKFANNMGGTESVAAKQVLGTLENISSAFSVQSLRGTKEEYKESKAYYRELQGKDKSDWKAMSDFEKSWTKLSHSFGNLVSLIAGKLAPALIKLTSAVTKVLDSFVSWLDSGPLERFVKVWEEFFDWLVSVIKDPSRLLGDTKKGVVSLLSNLTMSESQQKLFRGDYGGYAKDAASYYAKQGAQVDTSALERVLAAAAENMRKAGLTQEDIAYNLKIIPTTKNGVLYVDVEDSKGRTGKLLQQQIIGRMTK